MLLEKWYGDIVAGPHYHIFYAANLKLGPLTIGYHGLMTSTGERIISYSPKAVVLPSYSDNRLTWPSQEGEPYLWIGQSGQQFQLHRHKGRSLTWTPVVSNGQVLSANGKMIGSGYAEKIQLEFAPWKLELKILNWGRFCGQRYSMTWIDWTGGIQFSLGLFNGEQTTDVRFDDNLIRFGEDLALGLTNHQTITDSKLLDGALKNIPLPKNIKPLDFLNGRERKHLSKGTLRRAGQIIDYGHVIHETVIWGNER